MAIGRIGIDLSLIRLLFTCIFRPLIALSFDFVFVISSLHRRHMYVSVSYSLFTKFVDIHFIPVKYVVFAISSLISSRYMFFQNCQAAQCSRISLVLICSAILRCDRISGCAGSICIYVYI